MAHEGAGVRRAEGRPDVDLALLRGYRFVCRADCGLCCYASPRVEPEERVRLLQIAPETVFVNRGPDRYLAARPHGGACQFLEAHRCRVHAARPHPCREFPVTVHLGRRLQASLVLSCPGVDLSSLLPPLAPSGAVGPTGLEEELSAVRERLGPETARRLSAASRRGRKIEKSLAAEGRWQDDDTVRRSLRARVPLPTAGDFPVEDPPATSEGLDHLPIFFDHRSGPLGFARGLGGWEVVEFAPAGRAEPLGVFVPPERLPALDAGASSLLEGYLRYSLERDAFLAAVHLDMLDGDAGSVTEWTADALRALGAMVLARAVLRSKLHGVERTTLAAVDVEEGIRATDQDWLDRPTWGDRL